MRTISKHSQLKKTPAGESGSASCSPLPDPGTVNTDPAGAYYMTYQEQLKSPKWQKKRLEILERDEYRCQNCGDIETQLHVHHLFYLQGKKVWEYPEEFYITLCTNCHNTIHNETEKLFKSIATFYYNSEKHKVPAITDYISALRTAIKLSPPHINAFNTATIALDEVMELINNER